MKQSLAKIAYFYLSDATLELPVHETPRALSYLEVDNFPKEVKIGVQISVIGLHPDRAYTVHTKIFYGDSEVGRSYENNEIYNHKAYFSETDEYAATMSSFEKFNAINNGYYRYEVTLHELDDHTEKVSDSNVVHRIDLYLAIAQKWGR